MELKSKERLPSVGRVEKEKPTKDKRREEGLVAWQMSEKAEFSL